MAYFFGDGFDCYAAIGDALAGYWDSGTTTGMTLVAGRFAGSQCLQFTTAGGSSIVKSSGVNDAVHHIVCSVRQTAALTGTTLGCYFQLTDNVTNQVCIVFRSDGAILLTSATPAGTVLDTWTGAISAQNTWFAFEFEVVINNATGSWAARKNGNTSNDHALGSLNTRPGTNAYANKLTFGMNSVVNAMQFDDVLWRSDASSVPWVGDIRCYTRMPASDASVQWTPSAATVNITPFTFSTNTASSTTIARYTPFTPTLGGPIATVTMPAGAANTGNTKCTIFSSNAGSPGTPLGSATPLSNTALATLAFTFSTPVTVTAGTQYFVGFMTDTAVTNFWPLTANGTSGFQQSAASYAAFPTTNPSCTAINAIVCTLILTLPVGTRNAPFVAEPQQDGATSYVYDSNVNDQDFYNIAALSGTPSSTVGVTTRGFLQKSDAGTRGAAVQLKSGGSGSLTPTTWNPSDLTATTLSNANLTAAITGAGGVRSVFSVSSGKWYWEVTPNSGSAANFGIGMADVSAVLSSVWSTPTHAVVAYNNATYVNNVSVSGAFPPTPVGTALCIAVDMGLRRIWFRSGAAGNWNNSGSFDPAAGTGGYDLSPIGATLFALVASSVSGAQYTANFGPTGFVGAVPSGFTAGLSASGSIVTSTPTLLSTSWGWLFRSDTVDPATSAPWTATGVNNCTIGPKVTS